jgi:hypothetical protein
MAASQQIHPEILLDIDERSFHYRGYLLMCDPTRLAGGGYRAKAVVCRADHTGDTVVAATPEKVVFLFEEAAVTHAKDWGSDWVDENFGA